MRLNKYIASSGLFSRRKADDLIFSGKVKVNGSIVKEPWFEVNAGRDIVVVDNMVIRPCRRKIYLKLYKPAGYETTLEKRGKFPSLKELSDSIPQGVFPAGRLDVMSEGLVILTSDGEFSYILTHPKFQIPRRYKVKIRGRLSDEELDLVVKGVKLGKNEEGKFDAISPLRIAGFSWYEVVLHEGKYHEIRRVFAALGYPVVRLIRYSFGEIYIDDLKKGEVKKFSDNELGYVRELKRKFISRR